MTINQLIILNNKRFIIKSSDTFVNLVIHVQENTACSLKVIKHLNAHYECINTVNYKTFK